MAPVATTVLARTLFPRLPALVGWLMLVLTGLCHCGTSYAQERYSAASVEAVYLYRFAGYVEWPPEALARSRFTIAVLDDDAVADALSRVLKERNVARLPATLQRARSLSELGDAQMVYIGTAYRGDLHELISSLDHRPVLVVTDEADALGAGSMVNFVVAGGKVRFEVSLTSATRAGLKISSQLLAVAVRVQTGQTLPAPLSCRAVSSPRALETACPRLAYAQ